jgi:hypothetical protein
MLRYYKYICNNFLLNIRNYSNNVNINQEHSKCKTELHKLIHNYKNNELMLWLPIHKYNIDISKVQSKRILHEITFIHATCSSPKMLNNTRQILIKEKLMSLYSYADCMEKEIIIQLLYFYKLL